MAEKGPLDAPVIVPVPVTDTTTSSSRSNGFLGPLFNNPLATSVRDLYTSFHDRRASLGLKNPGTVEGISKEVTRDVFLNNLMFGGFRAEFNKAFSSSPLFQTAHSFAMGGNGGMPPYSFAALYGSPKIFLQGNVDNDLALSGRFNYRISKALTAKASLNLVPGAAANQSQIVLESDYTGDDFSATVRAVNPSILDFDNKLTGMFIGSYLQSVTPRLALGIETMYQRLSDEDGPQTVQSYVARYKGNQWIGSAALLNGGMLQGSYWRRLSEKVEAGLDINLSLLGLAAAGSGAGMMGGARNEGSATMGAKYDFRTSVFRGQIDSQGKVSAVLEKRIAPMVQFTFAGEMDHSKNTARIGMAVQIESAGSEEFMEMQERAQTGQGPPPQSDVPPF